MRQHKTTRSLSRSRCSSSSYRVVPSFFLIYNTRNHFEHEHNLELDRISNPNDISNSRIISNTNNFEPEQHSELEQHFEHNNFEFERISDTNTNIRTQNSTTRNNISNSISNIQNFELEHDSKIKGTNISETHENTMGDNSHRGRDSPLPEETNKGNDWVNHLQTLYRLSFPRISRFFCDRSVLFPWHVDDIPKMLPSP